ncbi:FAD-dependent monooxygenase [Planotetraspora kaengkrachanensis]|uniref:FAD-dependent oxidoreductase n=1 Tax=Planotetraspora kaengkrachanensis TaxID=575193 RepID=A0A8J3PQ96_9ACTN|nr:FAD-dependent monooxygenase [Planotetraspora kaengkrachanensis]GIG77897.1 FAD-dependent oxidoreductase [Planotetraspora kaengkrachanensis]
MDAVTDVVVVGAGPTGLLVAGDLAAAGLSCLVLERRHGESNLSRAAGVHARTLEQLDARDLADDFVAVGLPVDALRVFGSGVLDLSRLATRFPYLLAMPQFTTERLLTERARKMGVEFVPGAEVTGLRQDADGVDLDVRTHDGRDCTWRAHYVVGADGARSAVRHSLGLPFPGMSVARSLLLCDVRMADPPPNVLTADARKDGFAFVLPFGDGWYRVIVWSRRRRRPDAAPIELGEIREITRRVLGTDFGMHDPRWISRFSCDERQVPAYRVGRVFLAGDAAHVHSPAGGLGMNTGLQDAANLGWKLAAVIRDGAPAWLLDTYGSERHHAGDISLRISGRLLRSAMARPRTLRAAWRVLLRTAMRDPHVALRMAETISGIGLTYPAAAGAHPLVGRRAPDLPLAGPGPKSVYQALRCRCWLLVVPPGSRVPAQAAAGWEGRVRVVTANDAARTLVLVRPDGYVAWAAAAGSESSADRIRGALAQWCGPPPTPIAR